MHVKMISISNAEATETPSDILPSLLVSSPGIDSVMRHAAGAILQHPSSGGAWQKLEGRHVLQIIVSLVEPAPSNITSPLDTLDQPHTSDCVELPSLECGVQATGIIMLGLVAHPSATCPSMYEPGCVSSRHTHMADDGTRY
jgi:hypothetical protein